MNRTVLIELRGISKSFDGEVILENLDLVIHDKEFITLLGPSGCGKTTTLRMIGGFETPDTGDVFFDGKRINDVPPHLRQVNTVFQKYALFPNLNVFDNVAFGLRLKRVPTEVDGKIRQKKIPKEEITRRVTEMLAMVNLSGFEKRRVGTLSGGQQQRVAIARALIAKPRIVFADEPTGNLDTRTGEDTMRLLMECAAEFGQTLIVVTHNPEIAQKAQQIIRIEDGQILSNI